jgi:molecular chaperone DnaJ
MASQDWFEKDFYAILGVPKDADEARSRRPTASSPAAPPRPERRGRWPSERFKDIGEAHAVLSDPEQREEYDAIRQMAQGGARFTAGRPGGAGGFEDVFSGLFGGGGANVRFNTGGPGGAGGAGGPARPRGPPRRDVRRRRRGGPGAGGSWMPAAATRSRGFGAPRGPRRADVEARTTLSFREAVRATRSPCRPVDRRRITTKIPPGSRTGRRSGCAAREPTVTPAASRVTSSSRSPSNRIRSSGATVTTSPSTCR